MQIRQARKAFRRGSGGTGVRPDNQLAYFDQAAFMLMLATDRRQLMQSLWLYEHDVDFDQLRQFHRNFGYGLFGRRIERSPLPFGRHRWVSSLGPSADIDIAECPRPRAELSDWADECARLPIDPEVGPGWRLCVLPLTDGSTAISLVLSHYLADGVGALLAIVDAVKGNTCDLGYPAPRSRTRLRALVTDTRETAASAPEVARTLVAAARFIRRPRRDISRSAAPRHVGADGAADDRPVVVPSITLFIDIDDWDSRARILGGMSYSLLAGFAAKLAERLGRRTDDGTVALAMAISDRIEDDTRANAMLLAHANVDPTHVTTELSAPRVQIRTALKTAREIPDETLQLLPLIRFAPKWLLRWAADVFMGSADSPVSCSNLGDIDPAVVRPDGTDAEYVILRGVDKPVSRQELERAGGQLVLVSGRVAGKVSIAINAYQPGGINSKAELREIAARTLAEFELTGVIA